MDWIYMPGLYTAVENASDDKAMITSVFWLEY